MNLTYLHGTIEVYFYECCGKSEEIDTILIPFLMEGHMTFIMLNGAEDDYYESLTALQL